MHFLDLIMKYRDHIFNFYSSSDVLPVILKRSQHVTAKKYWLDLLVPGRFFVLKRGCVAVRETSSTTTNGTMGKKEFEIEERDRLTIFTLCALLTHFLFWWYFKTEKRWRRGTDQRKKSIFEGGRGEGTVTTWTNQSIKLPSLSLPN